MFDKIKNFIKTKLLVKPNITGGNLKLLYIMIVLIISTVLTYLFAWLYQAVFRELIILPDLLALLKVLFSPEAIAAIFFYGAAIIDKDGNGESDKLEEEIKKDKN
nr:MAG TPA: hypothetical protein [Caudoviricetes sp.]